MKHEINFTTSTIFFPSLIFALHTIITFVWPFLAYQNIIFRVACTRAWQLQCQRQLRILALEHGRTATAALEEAVFTHLKENDRLPW